MEEPRQSGSTASGERFDAKKPNEIAPGAPWL